MTHASQERGGGGGVTAPAGGPIADDDIVVKGAGRSISIVVNTVVERHGGHARGLHLRSHIVDIGNKITILAAGNQTGKAAARHVVGILVAAHVEILAALVGKVLNVLIHQRQGEVHRCGVGHVNSPGGVAVSRVGDAHILHAVQDGVHVTRSVQQGNYPDALAVRIADDGVHLSLGQLVICTGIIVCLVARLNTGLHRFARERTVSTVSAVAEAHITQQEAETVVAHGQLHVGVVVRSQRINDTLDLVHGEILSAAIQMENLHKGVIAFRKDGGRQ